MYFLNHPLHNQLCRCRDLSCAVAYFSLQYLASLLCRHKYSYYTFNGYISIVYCVCCGWRYVSYFIIFIVQKSLIQNNCTTSIL